MGLHGAVGGEPARLGGEVLGGVRFLAALHAFVVAPCRQTHHLVRGAQLHVGLGERVRDRLVGTDEAPEHLTLAGVGDGSLQRHLAEPTRHAGEQDPFRVEAMEDVMKAATTLADHAPAGDREPVVGHLARGHRVASELGDRTDVDIATIEIGEEQRQAVESALLVVIGTHEEEHDFGLERLARPYLATGDDPAAHPIFDGARRDPARVGASIGFGDAEGNVQVPGRGARQERVLKLIVAELHHRVEPEHRQVDRRRPVHPSARRGDAVEHERGFGDAATASAVVLGDGDTDPAAVRHRFVELPREAVLALARRPVGVVEGGTDLVDGVDDRFVIRIGGEVHGLLVQTARPARKTAIASMS